MAFTAMAESVQLATNGCQPQNSMLGRESKRHLKPIMEEAGDNIQLQQGSGNNMLRRHDTSHLKIEAWLSPMSDHFPTPRGVHYLAAPILPPSPSSVSADGSSPTAFSNPWNRASTITEGTEFEDIYDVSEDDADDKPRRLHRSSCVKKPKPLCVPGSQMLAPLAIPAAREDTNEVWSVVHELKKMTSPVPLTPSAKLPMSPAQRDFIGKQHSLEVPTISAPPSLDGSLSSEQLAAMSSPPTPVISNEEITEDVWNGVYLQPGALATLDALSSTDDELHDQPNGVIEITQPPSPVPEMQQHSLKIVTNISLQKSQRGMCPHNPTRQSLADLTKLSIPSPGGFFSGLSPRTRTTWHPPTKSPNDFAPPTSTTAEQFYRCPWALDATVPPLPVRDVAEDFYRNIAPTSREPVEHIVEMRADLDVSDDMPTAKPTVHLETTSQPSEAATSPSSADGESVPAEIVVDYDPSYARKQQLEALSNFDRTELWLMAQKAYLKGVEEPRVDGALDTIEEVPEREEVGEGDKVALEAECIQVAHVRKTVRFSNIIVTTAVPKSLPSKLLRQESAYYRAFQNYVVRAHLQDCFVHQLSRFEAIQAQRVALRSSHRSQLLGKYQLSVVPQSAKKRLSANVARGDDILTDDIEALRKEKEFEAMTQMRFASWHVAAVKFLNNGKLISAPVTKRLARLSLMNPGKQGVTRDRARILDLGGQSTCDWAWHCALQFPNAKIYTVTTKAVRQLSNSNIHGPSNHRQVAVERLTKLPFADNQFDLVSARELHSLLKFIGENGEDEWETCLRECMRVLKPGGYLEFSLLDSDIMNAGPLGLAKSVEFGFTLKTLGYDPSPTKLWLGRLARIGFQDIRRTWLCMPLGAKAITRNPAPPTLNSDRQAPEVHQMDAMVTGSTNDIAHVCSIAAGWGWERWLLRCEMESVAGELRLADTVTASPAMKEAGKCLEDVHAVFEEGRSCKAGFRMLNGYAKKPLVGNRF